MDPSWVLLFMIILVGVYFLFYYSPSFVPKIIATANGPFKLEETDAVKKAIVTTQDAAPFYSDSNGSLSAFVYLNPVNRTGTYTGCGQNSNTIDCTTGTYAPCACSAPSGDCSTCAHSGYLSVFDIAGVVKLEVLPAPDASRQGHAMSQLVIKTMGPPATGAPSGTTQQYYIETITLPAITLQKWTFVTVAREGRRFDIYYNDAIVVSHKTMYMPVSNVSSSNMTGVTSGSAGLIGQLAVVNIYNYRLSSRDVAGKYVQYANTRGVPYLNSVSSLSTLSDSGGIIPTFSSTTFSGLFGYMPSISLCPSGGCFLAPAIRPAAPMYEWSSPYA